MGGIECQCGNGSGGVSCDDSCWCVCRCGTHVGCDCMCDPPEGWSLVKGNVRIAENQAKLRSIGRRARKDRAFLCIRRKAVSLREVAALIGHLSGQEVLVPVDAIDTIVSVNLPRTTPKAMAKHFGLLVREPRKKPKPSRLGRSRV